MSYNRELAIKTYGALRNLNPDIREAKGGVCFMLNGHLLCAVTDTELITRIDPKTKEDLIKLDHVEEFIFKNRSYDCWIKIGSEALNCDEKMNEWLNTSVEYGKFVSDTNNNPGYRVHRSIK